ncbi:AIPR family protein [Bacillus sp. JJ1474]|uniref:AIPR family protein n=1 Tax=Bacillus sp. JJ1474 TaxID=3122955 RepID=UPI002FFE0C00
MNIQEFITDFKELHSDEQNQEERFVDSFCEYLESNGNISNYELSYRFQVGLQMNAYSYDDEQNKLTLIVADYENFDYGATVSKAIIQKPYKRAVKYLKKARKDLVNVIEETSADYPLSQLIHELDYENTEISVLILSNRIYKANIPLEIEELEGKEILYQIWDMERLFQLVNETQGIEDIEIDFGVLSTENLSMLKVVDKNAEFDCYVGYISGELLAKLYENWGQRLIERNVRSFLQAKGNVNKGIKNTLRKEQEMFIAYNNGISTVAESIEAETSDSGSVYTINKIKGLQVVNGGQTTASMYYTKKDDKLDLSNVFVQMKLTVIKSTEKMNIMTSKISEYANTQNKISSSDLKANHHTLIQLENLSRNTMIPSNSGVKSNIRWFFERARGQYLVDLSRETTKKRKDDFKHMNPKSKLLSKTDIAKYYMSWACSPHKVSKGGETNFKEFMEFIDQENLEIDQKFYKELIGMAILFKECDELVKNAKYPAYKANIITYTIAALSYLKKNEINLILIWNSQSVTDELRTELQKLIRLTWDHINNPPISGSNITSWCKKEECWVSYKEKLNNI